MRQPDGATYIYRKLAANPGQLCRVRLQLLNTARMRLAHIDGIASQVVDDFEVMTEHVRVLVILGVDVMADGIGEGQRVGLAERQRENVASSGVEVHGQSARHRYL